MFTNEKILYEKKSHHFTTNTFTRSAQNIKVILENSRAID